MNDSIGGSKGLILEARGLYAGYNDLAVVRDVSIRVEPGSVVALLGPNGAGKTTTMLTLAGELKPLDGTVFFQGHPDTSALYKRARRGFRLVTEERSVFMSLTVRDNLRVMHRRRIDESLELFPELIPLLDRKAGLLSGGEQQILTVARALAGDVSLVVADELSLGLAPLVIERLLNAIREAATSRSIGVLLVEQQIHRALAVSDYSYVMQNGTIVLEGSHDYMLERTADIESAYFVGKNVAENG